jgi:hypothetical protein
MLLQFLVPSLSTEIIIINSRSFNILLGNFTVGCRFLGAFLDTFGPIHGHDFRGKRKLENSCLSG